MDSTVTLELRYVILVMLVVLPAMAQMSTIVQNVTILNIDNTALISVILLHVHRKIGM